MKMVFRRLVVGDHLRERVRHTGQMVTHLRAERVRGIGRISVLTRQGLRSCRHAQRCSATCSRTCFANSPDGVCVGIGGAKLAISLHTGTSQSSIFPLHDWTPFL